MRTYTRKRPNHQLIENVHDLCRLCLGKADGVVPIFTEDKNNVCAVLALRIMICVGLEVKQEDCLPNVICTECLNNLNKYYAFRKKCEVSYQRLKSHVLAVKERQFKIELQEQNEIEKKKKFNATEPEEEMKLVVSFDRNQMAQVSLLNLNSIANVNKLNNKLPGVTNLNLEDIVKLQSTQEQAQESETPEPDIGTFLTAMLLQLGILTQQNGGPVLTEQSISSLDVETGDGSQVTFELVEEEEEPNPVLEESTVIPVDPVEKVEASEQNDVIIKYVASDYPVPKPVEKSKKAIAAENKKNGARCDECGKQLATRSALARHRRTHSGERPYACAHCGRAFGQKEVMLRHALVHQARRPHACAACPKSFTQRAALAAHERAHAPPHARALALHRCARCPKVFLYASGLSRHMLVHAGRVYVCGACERQFRDKSSLMRHFRNANHRAS